MKSFLATKSKLVTSYGYRFCYSIFKMKIKVKVNPMYDSVRWGSAR